VDSDLIGASAGAMAALLGTPADGKMWMTAAGQVPL